jgi:hypothetical protein
MKLVYTFIQWDELPLQCISTYHNQAFNPNKFILNRILQSVHKNVLELLSIWELDPVIENIQHSCFKVELIGLHGNKLILNNWINFLEDGRSYKTFLDQNSPNWFNTLLKYNNQPVNITIYVILFKG